VLRRKERQLPAGWHRAVNIQGWFGLHEARLLSRLCTGPWCEIGCHKGRSTTVLAETGHDGYAIDTWQGTSDKNDPTYGARVYVEFMGKVDRYENVIIVKSNFRNPRTVHLVPDNLHLLHLDADHSYEATKLAFELYAEKLIPGGHVCFHDAKGGGWPGVEQFVAELPSDEWEHVDTVGSLAAFKAL